MASKIHSLKGMIKNIFNSNISVLSFVSANNIVDPNAVINRFVKMKNSSIGRYSYLGNNTDVENATIGHFCSIADHCRIGMASHTLTHLSTCPLFTQKINGCRMQWVETDVNAAEDKRAILGNDVWVGSHVLINGGVTVGHGAVIGAGAVVVKDVPPYAIVGGVPAKVIRYRFSPEIIELLLKQEWWNMSDDELKEHIIVFQKDNITSQDILSLNTNNKSDI